ncbi:MAG: glutamate racemase [candidate division Zixibacteria bacterium]|nr:glutamate racemase [candidate division Zixibacteria bacterium]
MNLKTKMDIDNNSNSRPIGIFDSGVGGLTALRPLISCLPDESTVYFGDLANAPYGNREGEEIKRLSLHALQFFREQQVKMLVVACNSATAHAIDEIRRDAPFPVVDVILSSARTAVARTKRKKIGVIATTATVKSGAYPRIINRMNPELIVCQSGCPRLATLIEEGKVDSGVLRRDLIECHDPIPFDEIDTLILGCTHYPLIKDLIHEVCGDHLNLIDSGAESAREVEIQLNSEGLRNYSSNSSREEIRGSQESHEFYVSAHPDRLMKHLKRFLGDSLDHSVINPKVVQNKYVGSPALES